MLSRENPAEAPQELIGRGGNRAKEEVPLGALRLAMLRIARPAQAISRESKWALHPEQGRFISSEHAELGSMINP